MTCNGGNILNMGWISDPPPGLSRPKEIINADLIMFDVVKNSYSIRGVNYDGLLNMIRMAYLWPSKYKPPLIGTIKNIAYQGWYFNRENYTIQAN